MDDTNYFPEITETEYPAFVSLPVTGINPTYPEWITQQRQANLERARVQQRPVAVPVRLAEYKAFCDQRGLPYIAHHLLTYAMEHGPRR